MAENITKKSEEEYTKGLEDDLADLETYIEDISSSIPHPIYMANPNGIIIDMNKALEGLMGFGQEEMLGKLSYHLFREKEEARNLEKETLEKGVSKSQELTLLTKDKEIPVILNVSARKDIEGKVIGYAATLTDITELKQAEEEIKAKVKELEKSHEELRGSKEKYMGLVENVPDMIYSLNSKGEIISMNRTGTDLLGYTEKELLGTHFSKVLFKEDLNKSAASFNELKTGKRNITRGLKIRLLTKQGEIIHSELNAKATYDKDGNLVKTEGVVRDISLLDKTISELDKSRKELEKAYEELKTLDRMKSDFLEMVAHELRTPIVAIKIYTNLIMDEKLGKINKKQKEKIGAVSKNIEQLTKIINEMIDVSRIESGKLDIRKRYISIPELVKMVVDDMKPMADEKGQMIIMDMPESLPNITVDVDLVSKVFMNLLTNAVKYTHENGMIVVKAYDEEKNVHVTVQDGGVGIPEKELGKIFDKFYTGSSSEHKGIGLGLTIVKGIVEGHNGKTWAESIVGKGSTFHVLLPKKEGET